MSILRLRWLYAIEGASLGLLLPFLVPLLDDRGLGPAEFGLILGAAGMVSLLSYPIWGALADGVLGRVRSIAVAALLAALGGLWIMLAGSDPVALAMALSLALLGALPWGPLSDALALATLADDSSSYGRLRAWGSLGWLASAIAAGVAWAYLGPAAAFVPFSVSALAVAGIVLLRAPLAGPAEPSALVGRDEALPPPADRPIDLPGEPLTPLPEGASSPPVLTGHLRGWLVVLASPVLLGFLLSLLVTSVGEHASWRYGGLRILEQGGGTLLVALAAALPALVEIPVFSGSRRWASRLGLRMVYVWGALFAAGITLLIAFAPEPWMLTLLRTIDGTSYALRYIGMVLIIAALLPRRLHAVGQSLGWLVGMGIAPIIADTVGGLVYDLYGGRVTFLAAAALTLVGAAIAFVALSGPVFRRAAGHPIEAEATPQA